MGWVLLADSREQKIQNYSNLNTTFTFHDIFFYIISNITGENYIWGISWLIIPTSFLSAWVAIWLGIVYWLNIDCFLPQPAEQTNELCILNDMNEWMNDKQYDMRLIVRRKAQPQN